MNSSDKIQDMSKGWLLKRVILVMFTFVVSYFTSYIIFPASYWTKYFAMSTFGLIKDVLINFAFCIVLIEVSLLIDRELNKRMPWMLHPLRRLLTQVFFQITGALVVIIALASVYLIFNIPIDPAAPRVTVAQGIYTAFSIMIWSLMISTLNTGNFLLGNWKTATAKAAEFEVKAAQHKQLAAERELQALKLQLDPHFVFNNLSVLSELILKDQQLGHDYTENFARVHRYLVANSKKQLITLREELKFLDAYLFLIRHRMGNGIIFEIDIDESKLEMMIPPITLQLLIENALKYNRTEEENPLVVRVFSTDHDELVVSNILLPLVKKIESTGIGLKNIISRYALLDNSEISIARNSEVFTVKMPLIK